MNEIMTIQGIECYEKDGVAYLKLETVARGLGFTQTQNKNGTQYTSIRWETVFRYLDEIGFPNKLGKDDFIPENIFYRLAMKAKNAVAEAFQAKIADEVIPSIRRTGSYQMPQAEPKPRPMTEYQRESLALQKAKLLSQMALRYEGSYRQVLDAHVTKELTGDFLLPLPEMGRKTYSAGEIGRRLGISGNKVGRLANKHGLKTEKFGKWFHDKSASSAKEVETFRYFDTIIPELKCILAKDDPAIQGEVSNDIHLV